MHHDQTATLFKMVNQIAANFSAYEKDEAAERLANHLKRFWAPAMRKQLMNATDNDELSPVAKKALTLLITPSN